MKVGTYMEKEEIIYNDYLNIKEVYDKLVSKINGMLDKKNEYLDKINFLKQDIKSKTDEFNNEDKKRTENYEEKKEKYTNYLIIYPLIGLTFLAIVASVYYSGVFDTEGFMYKIIVSIITGGIAFFIGVGVYMAFVPLCIPLYILVIIIRSFTITPYLKFKYRKVNRSLIKRLNKELEIENKKLNQIENEISIKTNELNKYKEEFYNFLRSI